ncbi:MAG: undecaprenyl-diphosphate phosphatase [Thermodesulfobacteriota bacterium]|nr:undecaprenyl-diphosphate phosphatase [Thermodesulfobacteriota bacterium]
MAWLQAILLGIVQGLTEFLPVSSSGHLVLLQSLFGLKEPELFFDVSVHVGTLAAVCIFFFRDLRDIAVAFFSKSTWAAGDIGRLHQWRQVPEMRLLALIFIGSLPTAAIGLAFRPLAAILFSSTRLVGIMLLVTGFLLWFTRTMKKEGRRELTVWDALCVGVIQGLAILPGISRSGSTIAIGLFKGLDRETAARYSFLLSIPAIVGAMALELIQAGISGTPPPLGPAVVGACVAGAVGYVALKALIGLVKKGTLYTFAFYCWPLGGIVIFCSL